jgi:hypothetical protein
LRGLRVVLVDHMDDVLREALVVDDAERMFGPRRLIMEYRAGEFFEQAPADPRSRNVGLDIVGRELPTLELPATGEGHGIPQ